jgi:hypothetical protein
MQTGEVEFSSLSFFHMSKQNIGILSLNLQLYVISFIMNNFFRESFPQYLFLSFHAIVYAKKNLYFSKLLTVDILKKILALSGCCISFFER